MPILTLGADCSAPGMSEAQIKVLKAQFDASVPFYSAPGGPEVGFVPPGHGSWVQVLARHQEMYAAQNYDYTCGVNVAKANTLETETLRDRAARAVAKVNLEEYGYILRTYPAYLSADDRALLDLMFIRWKDPHTAAQVAALRALTSRLPGWAFAPSDAAAAELCAVHKELGGTSCPSLSQGTYSEEIMAKLNQADDTVWNLTPETVSNGGSQALTAADWSLVQGNQAVATAASDASKVSPLETGYTSPTQPYVREAVVQEAPVQKTKLNPLMFVGAFLLFKLLRR